MKILDTDILSLFFHDHPRVAERHRQETDEVAITIVSRIQVLQGRFAMLLKGGLNRHQPMGQIRQHVSRRAGLEVLFFNLFQ